jgi:hypothetical protein
MDRDSIKLYFDYTTNEDNVNFMILLGAICGIWLDGYINGASPRRFLVRWLVFPVMFAIVGACTLSIVVILAPFLLHAFFIRWLGVQTAQYTQACLPLANVLK